MSDAPSPALQRLRGLQAITLAATLAAIAVFAYGRWVAPPPPAAPAEDPRVAELIGQVAGLKGELEALRAEVAEPAATPAPPAEEARLDALERADREAAAALAAAIDQLKARPAPAGGATVRDDERWVLFRFRKRDGEALEVARLELSSGREAGFDDDLEARLSYGPVSGQEARLPLPTGLTGAEFASALLFAQVAIQTDNGVQERRGLRNRIWLQSQDAAGVKRVPLFAHFFKGDDRAINDPVLKTASTTAALAVGPTTQLALVIDAEAFRTRLRTSGAGADRRGRLDVLVRLGPALVEPAPQEDQ